MAEPDSQIEEQSNATRLGLTVELYQQLKVLAHAELRKQAQGRQATLNTTALVHEAYLKLDDLNRNWSSDHHFYATMAKVMRHILVDAARRRARPKHGSGQANLSLEGLLIEPSELASEISDMLSLDRALKELGELDPRLEQVIEMRFFGGMSISDVAAMLGISEPTVKRDSKTARAFLAAQLS